tara:strand:- start:1678 stop:2370 length:693 start_codon:yes stop_codon:yes gene_type:complete
MQANSPDRFAQVEAAATSLFDVPVAVVANDPRRPQPDLLDGEETHLTRAFPNRIREFSAGRAAARDGMARLDMPPQVLMADDDRAPVWPEGVQGSISHTRTLCVAGITTRARAIGIDIEDNSDLDADLVGNICTQAEIARIQGPHMLRLAKLIFSAKEAAYKAQYPLTKALFEFHYLDVTLDYRDQSFIAEFVGPAGEFQTGDQLRGRFGHAADHLITGVTIAQADASGI